MNWKNRKLANSLTPLCYCTICNIGMYSYTFINLIMYMCALAETTPCPLYEDETIVQQPADFLKLSETYSTAATGFIHEMAGMYHINYPCDTMHIIN